MSFAALLPILLLAPAASAQVSGTVLDPQGLPVADAIVTLQATDHQTTTAPDGSFNLASATGSNTFVVAAKKGWFNGFVYITSTPMLGVQIDMDPVPAWDDPTYDLQDPATCSSCHIEQYEEWNGSPMQQAGTNLWLYDIYDGTGTAGGMGGFVYERDSVHLSHAPHSDCAPCHQPVPWVKTKNPDRPLDDINQLSLGATHGISCEVCHKIAHVDESKTDYPGLFPQQTTFTKPPPSSGGLHEPIQYGALADTAFQGSIMRPSYNPQMGAAMCATCHQDTNDHDDDGQFGDPGSIVSEPTWDEWTASEYSDPQSVHYATCVDCHMKPTGSNFASTLSIAPFRDAEEIRGHDVRGTTPEYLENAADVFLTVNQVGTVLTVEVDVENSMTGHSLPTGVTVRNVILLVEAFRDSDGATLSHTGSQVIHDLAGVGSPSQGYFAGLPGKLFGKHNLDASGAGPVFYTEATGILFDTRIEALATDSTSYTFDVPAGTGPVSVRARLIYRRAYTFLTDAKGWTVDGKGNPLADKIGPDFGHLMEDRRWPDAPLVVSAPILSAGAQATVQAEGAWAGNKVVFVSSTQGTGLFATKYGFDIGLADPVRVLGHATADAQGIATLSSGPILPAGTAGKPVWFQAIERKGIATFELSDVLATSVQ
ncbi:MAG: carboxypeptidase-like regulatory domain-containing protein [Planctomycetota bacterium]